MCDTLKVRQAQSFSDKDRLPETRTHLMENVQAFLKRVAASAGQHGKNPDRCLEMASVERAWVAVLVWLFDRGRCALHTNVKAIHLGALAPRTRWLFGQTTRRRDPRLSLASSASFSWPGELRSKGPNFCSCCPLQVVQIKVTQSYFTDE